jgi:hypothetical protein
MFTTITLPNGTTHQVWVTFSAYWYSRGQWKFVMVADLGNNKTSFRIITNDEDVYLEFKQAPSDKQDEVIFNRFKSRWESMLEQWVCDIVEQSNDEENE